MWPMERPTVEEVEQRRAQLSAALASTSRQLRLSRAAASRAGRKHLRAWVLPIGLQRTVLIIYVLCDYAAEPAARYLSVAARVKDWPARPESEVVAIVEDLFLQAGLDELAALANVHSPSDAEALAAASKCVEEWRLCRWARQQNLERGVAPPSSLLLQRLSADRVSRGSADTYRHGLTGRARMFMTRFRQRWAGHYGALREADDITTPELVEKAFFRTPNHPAHVPRTRRRSVMKSAWEIAPPRDAHLRAVCSQTYRKLCGGATPDAALRPRFPCRFH